MLSRTSSLQRAGPLPFELLVLLLNDCTFGEFIDSLAGGLAAFSGLDVIVHAGFDTQKGERSDGRLYRRERRRRAPSRKSGEGVMRLKTRWLVEGKS